jgi:hypothetical protein
MARGGDMAPTDLDAQRAQEALRALEDMRRNGGVCLDGKAGDGWECVAVVCGITVHGRGRQHYEAIEDAAEGCTPIYRAEAK